MANGVEFLRAASPLPPRMGNRQVNPFPLRGNSPFAPAANAIRAWRKTCATACAIAIRHSLFAAPQGPWLGGFPFGGRHLTHLLNMHEGAFLVPHQNIQPTVAIQIRGHHLRSDA